MVIISGIVTIPKRLFICAPLEALALPSLKTRRKGDTETEEVGGCYYFLKKVAVPAAKYYIIN